MAICLISACCSVLCLVLLMLRSHGFGFALLISLGVFILLHLACFLFFSLVGTTVPKDRPVKKQNRICRFGISMMAETICLYAGIRAVVTGTEKIPTDSRFLFVCNHRSLFDPVVVMDKLRDYNISFISKPSNMNIPLFGNLGYAAGYLPIDRENNREALKTILTAADYMKRDLCSIGIFPEGTRSKTLDLLPFHAGSFKTAQKASVPIVVASIRGSEKKRAKPLTPADVYLDILECIPAETVKVMRTDALSQHVQELIRADLAKGQSEG